MSKTLASHYGENWTDEDKRMFDALVKEEMMKVEREFQGNGSIEEKPTRQIPGLYDRNSPQSQESSTYEPARYGRTSRSNSGISYSNRDSSERVIPGLESESRSRQVVGAPQDKNYSSNLSKADKYYAAMESKENSEQSFTSKLGEYENMSKDQRKLKQREYANQLSQQMSAIQNSTDDRSNVGRSAATRGRSATVNQYDDSNTFSIGVDPAYQRQAEKLKKQEYARMLNQQVDYQKSQEVDEDNIGRSRGYSDSKALSSRRLSRNSSPMTGYTNDDRQEPVNYGRNGYSPSNSFQIGGDSYDEKRRKKEKQAEYYKQLSADLNVAPSAGSGRSVSSSRQVRSGYYPEDAIPGGGSLNIGQRQTNASPRRTSKSIEDQDMAERKKNSQMEYYRMLEQDKINFNQKSMSQSLGESYQRPRVHDTDLNDRSDGTGLSIGRDPSMGGYERKQKQEEYRLALEQDAANKPYDPTSLEQRKPVRPPSNRSMEDPAMYNRSNDDDYSRETYQNSKPRSGSRSYAPTSNRTAMSDIMGGSSSASASYGQRSNPSWENPNSYNAVPRSGSNFRTRGTSTGGGASSFSLG